MLVVTHKNREVITYVCNFNEELDQRRPFLGIRLIQNTLCYPSSNDRTERSDSLDVLRSETLLPSLQHLRWKDIAI